MTDYKALEHDYGIALLPKRDLVAVRGQGALLYDDAGREYLHHCSHRRAHPRNRQQRNPEGQ